MIKICLPILLLFATGARAEPMGCSQSQGAIVFESATKVNGQLVIVQPRIVIDHEARLIASWTGELAKKESGRALCRALGYKDGVTGDVSPWTKDSAQRAKIALDPETGKIVDFHRTVDYFIESAVCE